MGFAEQKRKSTTRNIKVMKGKISLVEENIKIVDETHNATMEVKR